MKEFFELINEYPQTTVLIGVFILIVIDTISNTIRKH